MSGHIIWDLTTESDEEETLPVQVSNPRLIQPPAPAETLRPRHGNDLSSSRNLQSRTFLTLPALPANFVSYNNDQLRNQIIRSAANPNGQSSRKRKCTSGTTANPPSKRIQNSGPVHNTNRVLRPITAADGSESNPIVISDEVQETTSRDSQTNRGRYNLTANLDRLRITDYQILGHPRQLPIPLTTYTGECEGLTYVCAIGKCVELRNGSFLRIRALRQNSIGIVIVLGDKLVRQNERSVMSQRLNEVVWLQELNSGQPVSHHTGKYHHVPVTEIIKNRTIVFTNQIHPTVSREDDPGVVQDRSQEEIEGTLFCRWKEVTILSPSLREQEWIIKHLCSKEADDKTITTRLGFRVNARTEDEFNRLVWHRKPMMPGGSYSETRKYFDLAQGKEVSQTLRSYTFGDAFCGAGGTSRGAADAGLRVKWGFDLDERAIKSYEGNFGKMGTDCRQEAVHDFLRNAREADFSVDVLHISPPCQPFSPANTTPNLQMNEMNQAAMFSVHQLLETINPRVVTIEETDGLLNRHRDWFCALVQMLISHSYSVRWKVVHCQEYGVPQTRKRLFLIASAPGENLPRFAKPTHGPSSDSSRPFVTIREAFNNIEVGVLDHDTEKAKFQKGDKEPFSFDGPAKTVTCNVGEKNYHPGGTRRYTVREVARLQTFPNFHTFDGAGEHITIARKQIGNAVPPAMARAMYREILKSLKASDGIQ